MEDKEIIQMLCAHDARGMESLIQKYGRLLRYVIGGILQNIQDAEDCYNDVCLSLWQKAGSYSSEMATLATWLTAVARNAARNMQKSLSRREKHEGATLENEFLGEHSPEETVLRAETQSRLQAVIYTLDKFEWILFYRKYYYMQSTQQIAAELGMSERAVEGRLYRLRKRLQKELGGDAL